MAHQTTYDSLRAAAGVAVGRPDLSQLEDWERAAIDDAPNVALDRVASAARWPSLITDMTLSVSAGAQYVYLPADWQSFSDQDELGYAAETGQPPLAMRPLGALRSLRAAGAATGPPRIAAVGVRDTSGPGQHRYRLELWPTSDGDWTLIGTYQRRPAAMSVGADLPDLPYELHRAVETMTRVAARERFNLEASESLEALAGRLIAEARRTLLVQTPHDGRPLRDVVRRQWGVLPRGRNMSVEAPEVI